MEPKKSSIIVSPLKVDGTDNEVIRVKEKLRMSQEGAAKAAAFLAEIGSQVAPLLEKQEKLRKEVEYYQSRVTKYRKILGQEK